MPDSDSNDITRSHVQLAHGSIIGHYRIIERIGAGGMGEVYLAEDTKLDRRVALKFLPAHLCVDPECRARFAREAQAAAKLSHPNIVTIHEVDEFNGRPFFSMEHVEGQSLKEVIAGKTLPLERILEIGIQVCEGLQAAHEKGITHRDIKPSNILIDSHGRARIVDFGLASVVGSDQLTKTGSTLGTIGYMSPEQVRGEPVDHRTDLFSFGVVLYEMITGKSPFKAESELATIKNVIEAMPEPLARYKTGVPEELQRIVSKALAKDKGVRYQHADEMVADLKGLVSASSQLPFAKKSWRRVVIVSLVTLVALTAVLIVKPWRIIMQSSDEVAGARKRIAIVPFRNQTGEVSLNPVGAVIADWITQSLPGTGFGEVVPAEHLPQNPGSVGVKGIVDSTGADVLVVGSIYRPGDSLQFQARVISADGQLLQAIEPVITSDATIMNGVELVRQRVLGALALELDVRLQDRGAKQGGPPVYSAYREYMLGEQDYDAFKMEEALEHYQRAYAEDTTFLAPIKKSAGAYWNLGRFDDADSIRAMLETRRSSMTEIQQLALDEGKAISSGNWNLALQLSQRIAELLPGPWSSYSVGWDAMAANRPREAIRAFETIDVRRGSSSIWSPYWDFYARAYHVLGDHEKELSIALEGSQFYPEAWDVLDAAVRAHSVRGDCRAIESLLTDFQSRVVRPVECTQGRICHIGHVLQAAGEELRAHGFEDSAAVYFARAIDWYQNLPADQIQSRRFDLTQVLAESRQFAAAGVILKQLVNEFPDSLDFRGWQGIVAAKQGQRELAVESDEWLQNVSRRFGCHTYYRACIAAALGDRDRAVALLRETYQQGKAYWITDHREFAFENLRDYPPFVEILKPKD